MKRSYQQKKRAEGQDRTRQKIVDAAVDLHQSKGLAATSMSDIAKHAKVGKVTVYRHFANEAELIGACSGQYFQQHPLPDIESWRQFPDFRERLKHGLLETYTYHQSTEPMMSKVLAEAGDLEITKPYHDHWKDAVDVLIEPLQPVAQQELLKASLALALSFDTWKLLTHKQGLTHQQAIQIVIKMI